MAKKTFGKAFDSGLNLAGGNPGKEEMNENKKQESKKVRKQESKKTANLNFKVTPELQLEFKSYAYANGMKMNDLFEKMYALWRQQESKKDN